MSRAKPVVEDRWSPLLPAEDAPTPREYRVRIDVRRYKGGPWHLANLPRKQSTEIKQRFGSAARGWGSIRVRIKVGNTEWNTSLFPDKKSGTYLFLIKAEVRKAEDFGAGDRITAQVTILQPLLSIMSLHSAERPIRVP